MGFWLSSSTYLQMRKSIMKSEFISSIFHSPCVVFVCILCAHFTENGQNHVANTNSRPKDELKSGLSQNDRWNSFENLLNPLDEDPDLYIVKHDYSTDQAGQLSIKKGDRLKISRTSENGDWCEGTNCLGEIGWVPASYITKLDSLEKHSWFHGNITRAEAELSLGSGINGSFLVRESESKPGQYSISLRYDGRVFHYRIHQDSSSKFFVTPESKFDTLPLLVVHHSKNPDGLTTTLHYPAPNPRKPPIYSLFHEVDEWELDRSDIDMGQKLGGGQYGEVYKALLKKRNLNVPVAVKTFRVRVGCGWVGVHACACVCACVCNTCMCVYVTVALCV